MTPQQVIHDTLRALDQTTRDIVKTVETLQEIIRLCEPAVSPTTLPTNVSIDTSNKVNAIPVAPATVDGSGSGTWKFPNEIQCEIFRHLGQPSKDQEYLIDNFNDVHPGYAICSTSRGLRANYLVAVGYPPDKITISIRPDDYLTNEGGIEAMRARLKQRLALLGPIGVKRITSMRIYGPIISRQSESIFANTWLSREKRMRLDPGVLDVIKQHIEQDLVNKENILQQLFTCISELLKTQDIKELRIFAGELPASTWQAPLTSYLVSQESIRDFEWIRPGHTNNQRGYGYFEDNWPYFTRLAGKHWFKTSDQRPNNYPESPMIHRQNFNRLTTCLLAFLLSRRGIQDMSLANS